MLKERRAAMDLVTAELFPAEEAIDIAISASARLLEALVTARRSANLALCVGQTAIDQNISALVGLGQARRCTVATHAELGGVQHDLGLGAVAVGSSGDKPPSNARLREVA